ncbi:bifunctional (p)ppGpp synthetase/guanosine-3',5'-bis(diphosphate) 3'-pyrophosphohydrolase [Bacillus clarus]|uniref:Bifunctional (P)ppGpp synthetase/guanosine-3',5'-bis(Diphosphate) 3'-pyrophosphohydrolase n=1 Tax=Bacillus clarus TaxID=2338372 RepID=A0ABX9KNJ1_9BACI|nr:bifunctional (p)ppGpp synthetase/guanosine-3',5'-bis(diphosphate) 3'-pyrophosphohydrolase [Bacillus clarus]
MINKKADYLHPNELKQLKTAILFAERTHSGQYRKTGEPHIFHPFAVIKLLLDYKADSTILITALLHDVVEDIDYSLEQAQMPSCKIEIVVFTHPTAHYKN